MCMYDYGNMCSAIWQPWNLKKILKTCIKYRQHLVYEAALRVQLPFTCRTTEHCTTARSRRSSFLLHCLPAINLPINTVCPFLLPQYSAALGTELCQEAIFQLRQCLGTAPRTWEPFCSLQKVADSENYSSDTNISTVELFYCSC